MKRHGIDAVQNVWLTNTTGIKVVNRQELSRMTERGVEKRS